MEDEWLIVSAKRLYEACMTPQSVCRRDPRTGEYVETGESQFDSRGAGKALEIYARAMGLFSGQGASDGLPPLLVDDVDNA